MNRQYKRYNRSYIVKWILPGLLAIVALIAVVITQIPGREDDSQVPSLHKDACPQYPPLRATSEKRKSLETELKTELGSDQFFQESTKRMQGAVQIPTESFDDLGAIGEDKRWEAFIGFQEYLKETFPLV